MKKNWFIYWFNSPFYHKLYFKRDEDEAEMFITQLIEHLNPEKKSSMLDVACGKGRHSKTLAQQGFSVTGIDISEDSIAFAKQLENENLEFYQHDMRLPFRINYYDFVFNIFTSFGYFNSRRENEDALHTITSSLKPGGILILDYLNIHYVENKLVYNEEKIIDKTHYEIHRWHDTTHFYKRIRVTDSSLKEPMEHIEKVEKISLGDFTDMFSYQHLQVQEVFGNYQLHDFDVKASPRLILIAKKLK